MQVQGLTPHDHHPHLQYCEWLVQEHERDPGFVDYILWTDVWADPSKDGRTRYVMPVTGHKAYTGKEEEDDLVDRQSSTDP
jgi:hypothetical protein